MRPWEELSVSTWPVVLAEIRGQRVKSWVQDPQGTRWLRKEPRDSRPFEVAIEALMLRLAEDVGINAAVGSACTWTENGTAKKGLAVRLFLDRTREELKEGSLCMRRGDIAYDPESKWDHTLDRVRSVLQVASNEQVSLLTDFAHMIAFDAWIGNADRHQGNWGIIEPTSAHPVRLAPMYDPAACLGAELLDGNRHLDDACESERLDLYISRCPSGFGNGTAPIALEQLVDEISTWPEWQNNVRLWVAAFAKGMDTFEAFLPTVPSSWLPQHRKQFALRLLNQRLRWLERRV